MPTIHLVVKGNNCYLDKTFNNKITDSYVSIARTRTKHYLSLTVWDEERGLLLLAGGIKLDVLFSIDALRSVYAN